MSSALSPAMAELMSVVASPDERELASTLITSSMITPSTTQSGLVSPKIDVAPRMRIFGAAPKVPETFCTDTPARAAFEAAADFTDAVQFDIRGQ